MNNKKIILLCIVISLAFALGLMVGIFSNPAPSHAEEAEEVQIVYVYIDKLPEEVEVLEEETEEVEFIIPITEEEVDLLTRLVSAEAKGESYEGMVAVANVVINRLNSPKWKGETIKDIIFEPRQFQPVSNGAINQAPTEKAVQATMDALNGVFFVPSEVDCFANKSISFKSWADYYTTIQNHSFWVSK